MPGIFSGEMFSGVIYFAAPPELLEVTCYTPAHPALSYSATTAAFMIDLG